MELTVFEFDKYDRRLLEDQPSFPTANYDPETGVKEISLLFWAEHCVECAAPSCYETCDLYQPREDKRCRRFGFGALKNRRFRSLRGYGVEVSFKKWAKIETVGNASMVPIGKVLKYERVLEWVSRLGNVVGRATAFLTRNENWSSASYIGLQRLVHRLEQADGTRVLPDVFLLEVYNPCKELVRMQLTFGPFTPEEGRNKLVRLVPSFLRTMVFPPGYSRHQVEPALLRSFLTSREPFKISMIPEADSNARLVFLTADFVTFVRKPASTTQPKAIKCVVWDLDNTLWDGTLIEGDQVSLRPGMKSLFEHMDERGILLSVASKNDQSLALAKLEDLGVASYFLYPQINWGPKSEGLKKIAEQLNIGIDTFAFVDDNLFELDQVSRALPDVVCINASDASSLFSDPRFQGSASSEARRRRQFYQQAMSRDQARIGFGDDYVAFLASSEIVLQIAPYSANEIERVSELVQRTNQLNFSGHKYTREQLVETVANPILDKYVLKCSDKYGSYGTVGFGIVEQDSRVIRIRDFMLSCRVQGKFIEQAFFHHIGQHHNPQGATALWVNFRETSRNRPAQQVLELLGFRGCNPQLDQEGEGVIHRTPDTLRCDFIHIECSAHDSDAHRADVLSLSKSAASN